MPPRKRLQSPKTFELKTSRDVLEKLRRELSRLSKSADRDDVIDHGTNAAMTAWHLVDWIWREIKASPDLQKKVSQITGIPSKNLSLDALREFAKKACPAIKYCESIAISTKHLGCPEGPNFETGISSEKREVADSKSMTAALEFEFGPLGTAMRVTEIASHIFVIENDKRTPAAQLLRKTYDWWKHFLDQISKPD